MKTLKHYLSVISYSYKIGLKKEMEYISYSICWFIMIPMSAFSGYYVLKVITDQNGEINGWTLGQIAFLYGLSLFSHGFQDLMFIQTRYIDNMVISGVSFWIVLIVFLDLQLNLEEKRVLLFFFFEKKCFFVWNIGYI